VISLALSLEACPKFGDHFCTAASLVHVLTYGGAFAHGVSNLCHGLWAIHCHHQLNKCLLWLQQVHAYAAEHITNHS